VGPYPGPEIAVGTDPARTVVVLKVPEKDEDRRGPTLTELRSVDDRAGLAQTRTRVVETDGDIHRRVEIRID
jgi:hypothetical protein